MAEEWRDPPQKVRSSTEILKEGRNLFVLSSRKQPFAKSGIQFVIEALTCFVGASSPCETRDDAAVLEVIFLMFFFFFNVQPCIDQEQVTGGKSLNKMHPH